jgi:hypothetical protein
MSPDGGMLGDAGKPNIDAGKTAATRIPLVTPPVKAATPPSLGGTGVKPLALRQPSDVARKLQALDSMDLKSRFFTAGPTSIFQILDTLDRHITEINNASASTDTPCLQQAPVAYTLTPFGESLTFHAQCFQGMSSPGASPASFFQFGQKDGTTYLYVSSGVQHVAARITPVVGTDPQADAGADAAASGAPPAATDGGATSTRYRTDVWIGIGYNNATECGPKTDFAGCSYGAIVLHTDETRLALELTVAGLGFGYCGAQLKSDGTRVYARGSLDMGSTCLASSELCVAASDIATPADCTGLSTLASPPLGRKATTAGIKVFGASLYPGGASNQIQLDGTSTDSLRFGPTAPTSGVGEFTFGPPSMPGSAP